MLYPKSDIAKFLSNLGIHKNDTIFIHGDAGVASQFIYHSENAIKSFFDELIDFIKNGTIIVPSFSYSATKGKIFNVDKTPSDVGLFSERFRLIRGVKRSLHPIFSVCALGKNSDYYTDYALDNCFGKNSIFDLLYKENVKIITLGCAFEKATFIHYVEQELNISYRYSKKFNATVTSQNETKNLLVDYFVRDLDINTKLNLELLETEAIKLSKIEIKPFGRFKARCLHAKDFFEIAANLIESNEYALIEER